MSFHTSIHVLNDNESNRLYMRFRMVDTLALEFICQAVAACHDLKAVERYLGLLGIVNRHGVLKSALNCKGLRF